MKEPYLTQIINDLALTVKPMLPAFIPLETVYNMLFKNKEEVYRWLKRNQNRIAAL